MRTLRTYLLAVVVALSLSFGPGHGTTAASAHVSVEIDAGMIKAIRHYRRTAVRLHRVMGRRLRTLRPLRHVSLRRARAVWLHRAVAARRLFVAGPAHRRAWLCIHGYEGSWHDESAPYYGGLQMDISFQAHYGGVLLRSKGTADRWTPLDADVGRREGVPLGPRLLSVAEHGPGLRSDLTRRRAFPGPCPYESSLRRTSSLTTRASARPFVAFIT